MFCAVIKITCFTHGVSNEMKGRATSAQRILPVLLGRLLLRWIFSKTDILLFVHRFVMFFIVFYQSKFAVDISLNTECDVKMGQMISLSYCVSMVKITSRQEFKIEQFGFGVRSH